MKKILVCLIVLTAAAVGVAAPQRFESRRRPLDSFESVNVGYDGKVAFVRVRYAASLGSWGRRGSREPGWAHDYPTADLNIMKILNDLTTVSPHVDGSNVYALDDPELMDHPIAYMSEPGGWTMSDEEAQGLRTFLLKGGFIIFDDFRGSDWWNLEEQMKRVVPEWHFQQIDATHPIFNTFFEIKSLQFLQMYSGNPTYWGVFEDNDPRKRLVAIANRDNDHGEYWEYADTGWSPVDFTNEAFKFGVNYFIYGLTR